MSAPQFVIAAQEWAAGHATVRITVNEGDATRTLLALQHVTQCVRTMLSGGSPSSPVSASFEIGKTRDDLSAGEIVIEIRPPYTRAALAAAVNAAALALASWWIGK